MLVFITAVNTMHTTQMLHRSPSPTTLSSPYRFCTYATLFLNLMIWCQHNNLSGIQEVERVHKWLPHLKRCSWPVLILCSVTLQTIFILFWYVSMLSLVAVFICAQDFIHKHFSIISLLFCSEPNFLVLWPWICYQRCSCSAKTENPRRLWYCYWLSLVL